MGTWGAGLYDDDGAADLRDTIALLAKIPTTGERLLEILIQQEGAEPVTDDEDGTRFWLVVADQFEKRGIVCARAFENALHIIDKGIDLALMKELEMSPRDLDKRAKVLALLAARLRDPKKPRAMAKNPKLPPFEVEVGGIYAFPTSKGVSTNAWFPSWEKECFTPDGWGALIVVDRGRAFDWLPWCAIASLSVDVDKLPTMDDAMQSHLFYSKQSKGAPLCVPKKLHMQRMRLQQIGKVELIEQEAKKIVSATLGVEGSVAREWSICSAAYGKNINGKLLDGPALATLVKA